VEVTLNKMVRKTYDKTLVYYSINQEEVTITVYPKFLKKTINNVEDYPEQIKVTISENQ